MAKKPKSYERLDSTTKRAYNALRKMVYRDLKAACIIRGMDFTDIVEGDHGSLSSWFINNIDNDMDRDLLGDFDIWMDKQLEARGFEEDDPLRKMKQYTTETEDDNHEVRTRSLSKIAGVKKVRKKKERNSYGIFKGTKKEYTYTLCEDLLSKLGDKYNNKELVKKFSSKLHAKILKKFDTASEKSIRIWMKKALNEIRKQ